MINTKRNFFAIPAVATAALLASAAVFGQLNSTRVTSDISLVVDGGAEISVTPVISESAQSDLLNYDLLANEVQFATGVLAPDYNEPFFCFDMGEPQSAISIRATDPNGHLIVDGFAVDTALEYVPGAPSILSINPAADQKCFYRSDLGIFGLFGLASTNEAVPADTIMRNRFETDFSLNLEFQGVPEFVTLGETFSYDLVVTNTGDGNLNKVALQEVFPENIGVYAAALNNTTWTCTPTGAAVCPASSADPGSLRFNDFSAGGVDMSPGSILTFTIERTVDANSITGESIRLHAGTVADPVATGTPFAVADALTTVVGASAGLSVSGTDAVADGSDSSTITVTVLDANGNPVPDVTVSFDSILPTTSAVLPTSDISDTNGQVVFDSGTTTTMGEYTASFSTDSLSGSDAITFDHGPAAQLYVNANNAQAVADGTDAIVVNVLVEDANGNPVDSEAVDVVNNGGLTSLPSQEFTNIDGLATFSASSTDTGVHELEFSVSGAGNDFATVEFVAGNPDDLVFTVQPSSVVGDAETVMSPAPTLQVVDADLNLVADDSSTNVQLRLEDSTGATVISGLANGEVVNGEIQFSNLTFDASLVGTGYRIKAVGDWKDNSGDTHFFGVTSTSFDITSQ